LLHVATSSLEGFSTEVEYKLLAALKENRDIWEWSADDHYSREAVANIRRTVNRFLKLSPVLTGVVPNDEVSAYLREATRCYIYGFSQASIALSRAALEAGLNEFLKRKMGSSYDESLTKKIRKAEQFKLIDRNRAGMAEDVCRAAGMVLHQKPAPDALAFDALVRTRGVLLKLYEK